MNNRIKTIIITITAIALAFGLLVSCDGNVITTRNNKLAYTEVLETSGGFVYKGQSYDLLSDILNVIKQEGSQEEPIRVTGNVSMRPVTIPEGMNISIDLGGNEIKFFDVKDGAVKASGEGTVLNLSNGALSLAKDDAELAVIEADGAKEVNLSALEIKADGQTALDLNEVKDTKLEEDVSVSGAVIVRGGEDSTRLTIANELSDVRMNGATLVVAENGKAVITENLPDHSDNSYVVSPNAALIDHTGTIKPEDIHTGVCYIVRERTYYYGSLSEAVQSLGEGDEGTTITFFADDVNAADIELNIPVTIDLAGHSVTAANNITLADGTDLTIKNSSTTSTSYFTGTVTSAVGGTSSLSVVGDVVMNNEINVTGSLTGTGATFKDDITASGNINLTGSKFDSGTATAPNVTSTNGDITMTNVSGTAGDIKTSGDGKNVTISNTPEADVALTTGGLISEGGSVTVIGSSATKPVTVNGDVSVSGALTSSNAVFNGAVSAETVTDGGTAAAGSVFKGNVSADGDISLTGSTFNSGTATAPTVTSTNGDISMANVSGTAGAITANGVDGEGNISIDNTGADVALNTGALTTGNGDITVKGHSSAKPVTVNGDVSVNGSLTSSNAVFKGNVSADGDISLTGSTFNSGTATAPNVTSTNGNISMTNTSGTIGEVAAPHISISNPQSGSHINSLNTNSLDVTDFSNNLTVDAVDLEGNGTSTITGGKYGDFDYNGTAGGSLTVNGGIFTDFEKTGAGASTLNGGIFTVKGTSANPNLAKIDAYLNMTGSNANITINYVPETNNKIELSSNSYSFGQNMGSNAQATISFGSSVDSQNKLTSGLVIDGGATVGFTFGNNVSFSGNLFVELGGTLTSNKDLQTTNCNVKRRYTDNTVSSYVSEEGSYTYKAQIVVTFNSNGGTGTMGKQGVAYNAATPLNANSFTRSGYNFSKWNTNSSGTGTNYGNQASVTLTADLTLYAVWYQPTVTFNNNGGTGSMSNQTVSYNVATKLNKSTFTKEDYNFIGWNTDSTAEAAQYDDEGNVTLTSDTTLYAIWQSAGSLSSAVEVPNGCAIVASCKIYKNDDSWTELPGAAVSGSDYTGVWAKDNYYYLNNTGSTVYVKGIVHSSGDPEEYSILSHKTTATKFEDYSCTRISVERIIGENTVQAMAAQNGTDVYWFSWSPNWSQRYEKVNNEWKWFESEYKYSGPTIEKGEYKYFE